LSLKKKELKVGYFGKGMTSILHSLKTKLASGKLVGEGSET
jgi:hypothetical protein